MKTKSALSYFGSDSEVAPVLGALLDHCSHVTIPFCGGLSILPHLTARAIVANDVHRHAINFFRQMKSPFAESLIKLCQNTLSHPDELDFAKKLLAESEDDRLCDAWAFWAQCWIGRKGKGGTKHQGGIASVRRTANGGTNASRIIAAANDLEEWAEQFRRCEFESRDFRELIRKIADRPDCGIYCDPPWYEAGRNYLHSFTDDDHLDLCLLLQRFQNATIVLRYDDAPYIRELYRGWNVIEASSRTQANSVKGEIWITRMEHESTKVQS